MKNFSDDNFKYRINYLLLQKPGTLTKKVAELAAAIHLSSEMVNKIGRYRWGDTSAANTDQIWAIADFYGVPPSELLNCPPQLRKTQSVG